MKRTLLILLVVLMSLSLMACTNKTATENTSEPVNVPKYPSDNLEQGQSSFTLKDNGAILSFKSLFPDGISSDQFKKALEEQFLTSDDVTLLNYKEGDGQAAFDFEFNSIEAIKKTAILMSKDTVVNVAAILQDQAEDNQDGFELMTSKGILYHYNTEQGQVTTEELKEVQDKTIVQIQGSNNAYYSVPGKILMTNKNITLVDDYTFINNGEEILIVIYESESN